MSPKWNLWDRVWLIFIFRTEFLRDGDQLASRMTGTIKVDGVHNFFESFMFGKVDKASGKLEYLIERSVWGQVGKDPEHGVN
jgi:hypothetical protein